MRGRERKLKHWWEFLASNFNAVYRRGVLRCCCRAACSYQAVQAHLPRQTVCQLIRNNWVVMGCWFLTSLAMGRPKAAGASRASAARLCWGRAAWPDESLRSAGQSLGSHCHLLALNLFACSLSNLWGMCLLALEMWKRGLWIESVSCKF